MPADAKPAETPPMGMGAGIVALVIWFGTAQVAGSDEDVPGKGGKTVSAVGVVGLVTLLGDDHRNVRCVV